MIRTLVALAIVLPFVSAGAGAAPKLPAKYRSWLERDVVYLIASPERDEFTALRSDAERDRFIERFWKRRDPTPETPDNEFRDEHAKRLEDANRLFGVAGWKTDRGRIYISWGPPDVVETNPAGSRGFVLGQLSEAPEMASELWTYYSLPARRFGAGPVQIAFVDRGAGDFELLTDPDNANMAYVNRLDTATNPLQYESAAFFDPVTGLRATDRSPEIARSQALGPDRSLSASANTFERIELTADLQRTPAELLDEVTRGRRLRELEQDIRAEYYPRRFPVTVDVPVFDTAGPQAYCPVAVTIPGDAIVFTHGDRHRASLIVRGEVKAIGTGQTVRRFAEALEFRLVDDTYERGRASGFSYYKSLILPPGDYDLQVAVKDSGAQAVGLASRPIHVPGGAPEAQGVRITGLVLGDAGGYAEGEKGTPFTFGSVAVQPRASRTFRAFEMLHALYAVRRVGAAPGGPARVTVDYTLLRGDAIVWRTDVQPIATGEPGAAARATPVVVAQPIALTDLAPGTYVLQVKAIDHVAGRHAIARAEFVVQ